MLHPLISLGTRRHVSLPGWELQGSLPLQRRYAPAVQL